LGNNVLHFAAMDGHLKMVICILDKTQGIDSYKKNKNGKTPRNLAIANKHLDVSRYIFNFEPINKD
jgi:ankyrin repeat protein